MNETVKQYLSGKISYKEAINIMYPIYLADVEELKRIISERKIINKDPSRETEWAEEKWN
jgi:hypothetical protein